MKKTPKCELYAYIETTIAAVFQQLYRNVQSEIELTEDLGTEAEDIGDAFFWRKLIFIAYESKDYNDPENLDKDEKPLTSECADQEEWKIALDFLEEEVLWDNDYALEFFYDMPPCVRKESSMKSDYYTAIPVDPKRNEAMVLLKAIALFCDGIIASEENQQKN